MSELQPRNSVEGEVVLHRAAWLVPVSRPPIENGAVLTRGDTILDAGPFTSLRNVYSGPLSVKDHGQSALVPALVNPHTHLELTCLQGEITLPKESFASWLNELMPQRGALSQETMESGALKGKQLCAASGVCLCGDISNGARIIEDPMNQVPESHIFLEVLGFNADDLESALEPHVYRSFRAADENSCRFSLAAHACYSTSAKLIQETKAWSQGRGLPFSIHVAEHADEIEFLRDGTGFCRDLLQMVGRWLPGWTPPGKTPVQYLDDLGALDEMTLVVHAVHMTDSDWEIVARRRSSVCFCPRSNQNLNTGRADIERAIQLGIPASLGTDSLASNTDLNLFAEGAHVLKHYPHLSPETVLAMMTSGGARALHQQRRFGSIEPGKRAEILVVSLPDSVTSTELFETIIHHGSKGECKWANCPRSN
jgi:aminodeoxyfutalosine deaminase